MLWDQHRELSKAVLKTSVKLPEEFTMCLSYKTFEMNGTMFLIIYDDTEKDVWLAFSNWVIGDEIQLWLRKGKSWRILETMLVNEIMFWIHLCFGYNIKTRILRVSLNGRPPVRTNLRYFDLVKYNSFQWGNIMKRDLMAPKTLQNKLVLGISENFDNTSRK